MVGCLGMNQDSGVDRQRRQLLWTPTHTSALLLAVPHIHNTQQDANPFADSTLYELNTTYVPPDLPEATVDAVVPAVPTAVAAAAAAGGGRAQQQQPAAAPPPGPATASGPAVPAAGGTVPALQFTGERAGRAPCVSRLRGRGARQKPLAAVCHETRLQRLSARQPLLLPLCNCCRVQPQPHARRRQHGQSRNPRPALGWSCSWWRHGAPGQRATRPAAV